MSRASTIPCSVRLAIDDDLFCLCFHSNISLISKCPKHAASVEEETAQALDRMKTGLIIVG